MIHLTITEGRFLEYYFEYGQDSELQELKLYLAEQAISGLYDSGQYCISVQQIFDWCNKDAIRAYFTEQLDDPEEFDLELGQLKFGYTLRLTSPVLNRNLKYLKKR